MFRLEGPYPQVATTVLLPSPRMSNIESIKSTVNIRRFMDGTIRTYINRKAGRKRHLFEFLLSVDKVEELEDYIKRYPGRMARIVWRGTILGHLILNPVERAGQSGEAYIVNLELEE